MNTYDLIVFDWDGTLMDSEARIVHCIQLAAADVGLAVPSNEASRDIIGLGLDEAMARLFPGQRSSSLAALVEAYRTHWLGPDAEPSRMFAGAESLVQTLHAGGHLLAVATGKSRRGLDKALDESGLQAFFHHTRCADETFSKPHPQMLLDILTDLDTPPGRTLVVGDTEYDMQMAANAGVSAVGVSHGVHAPERLMAHGATHCFENLFDLSHWLGFPVKQSIGE